MEELVRLKRWEQGLQLESPASGLGSAFFWFYEWNLFGAVCPGEHTHGDWSWDWSVDSPGQLVRLRGEQLSLAAAATSVGAALALEVENMTDYDWPEQAAIVPCFNPGDPEKPERRNVQFLDRERTHTYFYGKHGLELIAEEYPRAIHFSHSAWPYLTARDPAGAKREFVFSEKWPTSCRDAYRGLMIRESQNGLWVMGVAWDSFLSAQGHNPWDCMHLSIRVGPLKRGEKKNLRGRLYLFAGSKEDCLRCYERDFLDCAPCWPASSG
jgi:hypothetical protein